MSRLAAVARTTSFAAIIAAVFPVLAVIAPKSTVIVLVAAGLYGMIIAVRRRIWRDLFPLVPASLMAAVMGWILYKSLATVGGWVSFELWLRLTALVLCGFGALWLFRTLSSEEKRRVHDALIAGIVAGLLLLWLIFVAYRYSGIILVGADRGDPLTAVSSGQAIIAMLSGLAWCVLLQRRRRGAALLLIAATLASFAALPSNYAILAVILGVLGMVWGTSLHSSGLKALAVALVAAVLAGPIVAATSIHGLADDPVLIATIKRVDSTGSFERSIRHRLQIWAFVAERAQEHPYLGWGLDASRRIPGGNELTSLGAEKLPLHPHNGILQVWLELGVPGVVLLALIVGYATVAQLGGRNPPHVFAVRAATILPTLTIAGLAFGIWQNWWFSAIWLTVALVATFPAVDAAQASARR